MKLSNILGTAVGIGVVGGIVFSILGLNRMFGIRKINDIYTFQYHGKSAVIKHEDIRCGPDKIYFLINGKDKLKGTLISDKGKEISVYKDSNIFLDNIRQGYSIRDAK